MFCALAIDQRPLVANNLVLWFHPPQCLVPHFNLLELLLLQDLLLQCGACLPRPRLRLNQVVTEYRDDELDSVLEACERMNNHLTAAVVSNDVSFQRRVLEATVNGTTYCGIRAR